MKTFSFSKTSKKFSFRQKFEIGYSMLIGLGYDAVRERFDVSESYAFELKDFATKVLDYLDGYDPDARVIVLTKDLIARIVIALALFCRSSLEGIWRFMDCVFDVKVSVATASGIIKEAAERAKAFDATVSLELIKQGANDEIFQGNKPIFVGVDVESTYAYLIEPMPDRTAARWKESLEELKSHGLDLEVCISDQGTGLLSGVPKAFPDAEVQYDVFHELMELGKFRAGFEKRAESLIKKEYDLEKELKAHTGTKGRSRLERKYTEAREKAASYIDFFDTLSILHEWMHELLGFSGYSAEESTALMTWVIDLITEAGLQADESRFAFKIRNCKEKLPCLLGFLRRLEKLMAQKALELEIPEEALKLLYQLRTHPETSPEYRMIDQQLNVLLSERRPVAEKVMQNMIDKTKRASSLVENLNSRIRPFIHLKRIIPDDFFVLMKVFFNTKKFRRSEIKERVGKSPLELMTGKEQPDFFELLGY